MNRKGRRACVQGVRSWERCTLHCLLAELGASWQSRSWQILAGDLGRQLSKGASSASLPAGRAAPTGCCPLLFIDKAARIWRAMKLSSIRGLAFGDGLVDAIRDLAGAEEPLNAKRSCTVGDSAGAAGGPANLADSACGDGNVTEPSPAIRTFIENDLIGRTGPSNAGIVWNGGRGPLFLPDRLDVSSCPGATKHPLSGALPLGVNIPLADEATHNGRTEGEAERCKGVGG